MINTRHWLKVIMEWRTVTKTAFGQCLYAKGDGTYWKNYQDASGTWPTQALHESGDSSLCDYSSPSPPASAGPVYTNEVTTADVAAFLATASSTTSDPPASQLLMDAWQRDWGLYRDPTTAAVTLTDVCRYIITLPTVGEHTAVEFRFRCLKWPAPVRVKWQQVVYEGGSEITRDYLKLAIPKSTAGTPWTDWQSFVPDSYGTTGRTGSLENFTVWVPSA